MSKGPQWSPETVARARSTAANLERLGALHSAINIGSLYGCTEFGLLGGDRHPSPARARRHLWMVLRHSLDLSYPEIASIFGMDHTSILVGVRKAERELEARAGQ